MALSYANYEGTGTLKNFGVPSPYLSRQHVVVTVDSNIVAFTWPDTLRPRQAPHGCARKRRGKVTKEGELVPVKPQAATLNVIRQFPKDNDTEAVPGHNAGMTALAQAAARHLHFPRPSEDEQGLPQ
ncbi:hypothetical protein GCM10007874_68960 [Labrys miyagiensis]|uniref:Bacteriophage T7 tail fibre protein-like N-terminal domain-containing protein n=1 Tax=Labrys miyagiensis TaxID=346912 RepID=A0ABQ6CXX1_9HYPH|nr:hypothetical protein GCM10007874_68960 [Labrys miyagiensis]